MKERKAEFERKSKETQMKADLCVDGRGKSRIETPIGLLNHMLELFAFHGLFDLTLVVEKADTAIDNHHTNEDIGIVLGKVFNEALGDKTGIRRFGWGSAPMEATLCQSTVDISGRGYLKFILEGEEPEPENGETYSVTYLEHFLESFAKNCGANIHIRVTNPLESAADIHTVAETVFKSLGLALDQATLIESRRQGAIPSTKGIID